MKTGHLVPVIFTLLVLLVALCGCTAKPDQENVPVIYIVYGSEKGDLSYTDAAYQGILAAEKEHNIVVKEFVPKDFETLPALLNSTQGSDRPGLIITVGFQYADFTRQLAEQHPDIRFLAIDQAGIGMTNLLANEITSYADSYLAGALAASATKTGHVGIIMGMQSDVLDTFLAGYSDGARAVNSSIRVEPEWVHRNSTTGFTDAEEGGRIAERMYGNGTDVIFTCAGYSNMGAFSSANSTPGRYIIGTDSDQSPLGPGFVLASAVKRVDRIVHEGISDYMNGTFDGGNRVVGLKEGATGIVYNPKFAYYNETVSRWEASAMAGEEKYVATHSGATTP